jgi:hypothetical protein
MGIIELDSGTAIHFESAKAAVIDAIKKQFYNTYGVQLTNEDIQLSSRSSERRILRGRVMLDFTVNIPTSFYPVGTSASNSSTSNVSALVRVALDAAVVSQFIAASLQSDEVAAALNVSAGPLAVTVVDVAAQEFVLKGECPKGKYAAEGMGQCTSCAPGRSSGTSSSACSNCGPGTFAATIDSISCSECPMGKYQEEIESTTCSKCSIHSLTVSPSASSEQECVCEQGYFMCTSQDPSVCKVDECNDCPFDAACNQSETLESMQVDKNFWRATNSTVTIHRCPRPGSCKGGRIVEGDRNWLCNEGYSGVRCELCDYEKGYAVHQPGNKCTMCGLNEGKQSVYTALGKLRVIFYGAISNVYLCAQVSSWA